MSLASLREAVNLGRQTAEKFGRAYQQESDKQSFTLTITQ